MHMFAYAILLSIIFLAMSFRVTFPFQLALSFHCIIQLSSSYHVSIDCGLPSFLKTSLELFSFVHILSTILKEPNLYCMQVISHCEKLLMWVKKDLR